MDPDFEELAKAAPPELVAAAMQALRRHLRPPKLLARVLRGLWGDAALQGFHAASEQLGTQIGGAYESLTSDLPADYWDKWQPGWGEAAAQLASGGLARLLDDAGITIQSVVATRLHDLGDKIASGVQRGDSVDTIARDCQDVLSMPSRALMIADTECARAMTVQTMDSYRATNVDQVQWLAEGDACPDCLENEDASPIGIDDEWPNGPVPVHPNCRCAVAPHIVVPSSIDDDEG